MLNRIRDVIPPTKQDPADGISRAPAKTCGAEPADNASPAKLFVTESCNGNRATTVAGLSGLSVVVRVPPSCASLVPNTGRQWQQQPAPTPARQRRPSPSGPSATAPLAIHNHKAIFGWAANLFLAAATSQTTTAEKSGPCRLGDPVPGRGDVEGTVGCAPPAPAARCPHPTSHRAWPVVPSLGAPSPSQHRQALAASLYLSASSPFASLFMPDICSLLSHSLALNLIDNLSIGLVFYRWCFLSKHHQAKGPTFE